MTFLSLLRVSKSTITEKVKKVKCTLQQATKTQRGSGGITLHSLTLALEGGGWSVPRRGWFTPMKAPVLIL
jgi:hypothetical protein